MKVIYRTSQVIYQKSDLSLLTYTVATGITLASTCTYSDSISFSFNSYICPKSDESLPTMRVEFNRMYLYSSDVSITKVLIVHFLLKNKIKSLKNTPLLLCKIDKKTV